MAVLFLIALVLGYFLPSIIAGMRKHRNQSSLILTNLFFGWTGLGWVLTLIWAFSDNVEA